MKALGIIAEIAGYVTPTALAILANLGQHVKAHENPKEELERLLRSIDNELKPKYRLSTTKKET